MRQFDFCVVVVAVVCAYLRGVDASWTELSADGRDEPETSGTCGENVQWNFDKGTLSFSGSGDMYAYSSDIPWHPLKSQIERVVVGEGITSLTNGSFYEFSSLTSVEIAQSVTVIGIGVFYKCSELKSINLPDKLTMLGRNNFYGCYSLTTIKIPEGVTSLDVLMFYNCTSLTSITIPDTVTEIGEGAFTECSSLKTLTIPESVTSIGPYAFMGCTGLTSINIPDKVTKIEYSTFAECSSLTTIVIPESVTYIGNNAFRGCSRLTSVNIPDNVTLIDEYTFRGCSSLTSIIIPANVIGILDRAFYDCSNLKSVGFYGTEVSCGWPQAPGAPGWFSNTETLLICVPDEYNFTTFCSVNVTKSSSKCSALYNKDICDKPVFDVDKNEWVLTEWEDKPGCKKFTESRSDRIQMLVVMVYIMTFMFTIVLL